MLGLAAQVVCLNVYGLLILFFLAQVTHQMSPVSLSLSRDQTDAVYYVSMFNTMPGYSSSSSWWHKLLIPAEDPCHQMNAVSLPQ